MYLISTKKLNYFFVAAFVVLFSVLFWLHNVANAAFNSQVNYQGKLLTATSSPVADGTYSMVFRLYTVASGGSNVWSETQNVTLESGLFSVMLGTTTSLSGVNFNQPLYLGINVQGDGEMSPRKILGAVPAAFEAKNSATLGGVASTSFVRSDEADTIAASTASTLLTITQNGVGNILDLFDGGTKVFTVLDGGNVGIGTSTPAQKLSVAGGFRLTGAFYDRVNSAGTAGYVLQTNGSGTQWVATSSLGLGNPFGASVGPTELQSTDFGDFTCNGTSCSLDASYLATTNIDTSSELAGIVTDETGSGSLVFGTAPTLASTTITGILKLSAQTASRALFTDSLSRATTTALSAALANSITDETGSGRLVYSNAPAFSGTATFSALTASSTLTLSGSAANIALGSNYLSGDGDDEGIYVGSTGNVGIGTTTPNTKLTVYGSISLGTTTALLNSTGNATKGLKFSTTDVPTFTTLSGSIPSSLILLNTSSAAAAGTSLQFQSGSSIPMAAITSGNNGGTTAGNLYFTLRNGGVVSEVARFTSAGNFGIGTSTLTNALSLHRTNADAAIAFSTGTTTGKWTVGTDYSDGYKFKIASSTVLGTNDRLVINGAGNVGIGTSSPAQTLSVAGSMRLTGAFYDRVNSAGTNGYVLQSNGSGATWVATSSLGISGGGGSFGASINANELASEDFGSFTCNGTSCTIDSNALSASMIGNGDHGFFSYSSNVASLDTNGLTSANLISAVSDETGSGALVFGTAPTLASTTITGILKLSAQTASRALFTDSLSRATTTALSAALANSITDETGSGALVFAASPTFTGTAIFATSTHATGTLTYANVTRFRLGGQTFTSLTGTGLTLSGSSLTTTLGTSIDEAELNIAGSPTDGRVLQASSTATGGFVWVATSSLNIAASNPFGASINANELASEDFGSFTCNGTSCTIDSNAVGASQLAAAIPLSTFVNDTNYITDISGSSFLDLADTLATFSANRIIYTNGTATSLADSASFTFNGTTLATPAATLSGTLTLSGLTASRGLFLDAANRATTTALSAALVNSITDETGSGALVFGTNPTFTTGIMVSGRATTTTLYSSGNISTLSSLLFDGPSGNDYIYQAAANSITFGTAGSDRMRLTSGGSLAIGTTTANQALTIFRNGDDAAIEFSTVAGANEKWAIGVDDSDGAKFKISSSSALGTNDRLVINGAGNVGIGTSSPAQTLSVAGSMRLTGAFYDRTNSAGTAGYVLQTNGSGTQWVATSSLGFSALGASINANELASEDFGSFTCNGTSCTIDSNALSASMIGNGDHGFFSYSSNVASLDTNGLTSANLISAVSDETGSGRLVYSNAPAFSGTATFSALTASSTLTLSGSAANIALGSNYLSGDGDDEGIYVGSTGNVGIGTTTPQARLAIDKQSVTGNAIAGFDAYYGFTNSTLNAVQYGEKTYIKSVSTATTSLVGNMIRLEDSTTYGNTIRGLEVQANRGTNTKGENTALSGFGRTFGVRGTTEGDAGQLFEPAGGFFQTRGTTQGNAIRGYSASITTANLLSLFQDTSAFAGTGLEMNFGNTTGTFASSTGSRFLDLQKAGTSKFIVYHDGKTSIVGTTTIGTGDTSQKAGLQIGYGGICVDNDGTCTATTTGKITSVSSALAHSDLAEMYFSSEALEPGDIVYTNHFLSVGKADQATKDQIIGVVSTKPGVTLGFDDSSLVSGQAAYPIALSGRVPIRLSDENGVIKTGDPLMLSSVPGVAMKATESGTIVGIALEDFDGTHAYSAGFVNQFGDNLAEPVYEASLPTDPLTQDGCHFGAGGETGTAAEDCVPEPYVPTIDQTEAQKQASEQARYDAEQAALQALRNKPAKNATTPTGETVAVGQVIMFVDLGFHMANKDLDVLTTLSATSTDIVLGASEDSGETLWSRVKVLAQNFVDGVLTITGIKANKVETQELCIDDVCVDANGLRNLLQHNGQSPTTNNSSDTNDDGSTASDGGEESTSDSSGGGETASSTEEVITEPEPDIELEPTPPPAEDVPPEESAPEPTETVPTPDTPLP